MMNKKVVFELIFYLLLIGGSYALGHAASIKRIEINCNQFIIDNYIDQGLPSLTGNELPFNFTIASSALTDEGEK